MNIDLVRDVLDKKLYDRDDSEMGRVDGLVMQFGDRTRPRITHIELGGSTLGARIHPAFARMAKRLAGIWGPKRTDPVRIPWSRVMTAGKNIKLDVKAEETGALDWEKWIARNIIERIPGAGGEEDEDGG